MGWQRLSGVLVSPRNRKAVVCDLGDVVGVKDGNVDLSCWWLQGLQGAVLRCFYLRLQRWRTAVFMGLVLPSSLDKQFSSALYYRQKLDPYYCCSVTNTRSSYSKAFVNLPHCNTARSCCVRIIELDEGAIIECCGFHDSWTAFAFFVYIFFVFLTCLT